MKSFNKFMIATLVSAPMLLPDIAQAMPIQQFDKMADQDQAEYVGLLVQGAEKVLTNEGKSDLAAQVDKLFLTIPAGDKMSLGMTEFEVNLARVRVVDANNAAKNPGAPRLEVEHAMILTLKDNDITLPKSFMHVGDGFQPKFPPAPPQAPPQQ